MNIPTYFEDLLSEIRLPDGLREKARVAHTTLRERLRVDADLKDVIVTTFLQGSYRRHTGVKPAAGKKCDVDVVVVTRIKRESVTPQVALDIFKPFLEKYYKGSYRPQGRSWRILEGEVELDLVPTSSPSEANEAFLRETGVDEYLSDLPSVQQDLERIQKLRESNNQAKWGAEILWIPDREAKVWRETNPIAQIEWTVDKNSRTDGFYLKVVKSTKWWRKIAYAAKHPKGYPLEHLIGANCPDRIESVAEGFVLTAEAIVRAYATHRASGLVPSLQDHGVTSHNVLAKLDFKEFSEFYDEVKTMAHDARLALEEPNLEASAEQWAAIFSDLFPKPPKFTLRGEKSSIVPGRFA